MKSPDCVGAFRIFGQKSRKILRVVVDFFLYIRIFGDRMIVICIKLYIAYAR